MKLSTSNLKQGMKWWQQGNWPRDYHNEDYYSFYQDRALGLTQQWLTATVDRLAQWRAIRSPRPPNTKAQILALLTASLPSLRTKCRKVLTLSKDEPSIGTVAWQDIDSLYQLMADIKNRSPVFASKLGHFMLPKVFIVMDNLGTDVMSYDYYWQGMVNEWRHFREKRESIDLLRAEIAEHSQRPIHPNYPFETKIMELCHVGDKWR